MLCHAMLYHAMPGYAMLCQAMLCCAVLCYAMLCYAMLCYAMLCHAPAKFEYTSVALAGWLSICDAVGEQPHLFHEEEVSTGQTHFGASTAAAI